MKKFVPLATLFAAVMAAADPSYSNPPYPALNAYPSVAPAYPVPIPPYPVPVPSYPIPAYPAPVPVRSKPAYEQPAYSEPAEENHPPMPFNFAYEVKDDASYQDFSHKEVSDGKVVTGSYHVALPDGRTQIVTYKADENGYVADVKYEGEAKYDEYKPAPAYPKPAYPAEPAYPKSTYPAPSYPAPAYSAPAYPAQSYSMPA
ncbi:cuticle protein 18.6-like [Daphnia carinata]|uniref:cuticle protein 18.6-like n=1 Tax=Daphnia carinata TaxID=120202 RepID=UPI00257E422A|nr:cuticle protein 18.6-like [Daphnia carinata]